MNNSSSSPSDPMTKLDELRPALMASTEALKRSNDSLEQNLSPSERKLVAAELATIHVDRTKKSR